jgi:hypothetical protein
MANQYVAPLQIACLEIEKARKGREKASALQRVETLDERRREIEAEKAAVLRWLAGHWDAHRMRARHKGAG